MLVGVDDLQNLTDVPVQKNGSLGTPYATKGTCFAALKCILIVAFSNWLISDALKSQCIWYELTVCLRRKVKFFHNSKPNWVENAILPRLHTVRAASGNCQEKKRCKDDDAKLYSFNLWDAQIQVKCLMPALSEVDFIIWVLWHHHHWLRVALKSKHRH